MGRVVRAEAEGADGIVGVCRPRHKQKRNNRIGALTYVRSKTRYYFRTRSRDRNHRHHYHHNDNQINWITAPGAHRRSLPPAGVRGMGMEPWDCLGYCWLKDWVSGKGGEYRGFARLDGGWVMERQEIGGVGWGNLGGS